MSELTDRLSGEISWQSEGLQPEIGPLTLASAAEAVVSASRSLRELCELMRLREQKPVRGRALTSFRELKKAVWHWPPKLYS